MAISLKDLVEAQKRLAKEDTRKAGEGQERMSISDFKKMIGVEQQSSKKQVELLGNIETLSIQNNEVQKDQVETQKTLVEKDDGTHTRLDGIKITLEKALLESKNQSKTLDKLEKTDTAKPSMEQSVEAERDRQESVKLLKKISEKLDGKGKPEEKKQFKDVGGLGGIVTALAIALGAIVGAISGYVKAIVKMNKMLFGAIESAIIGLGKFFPSLKKLLFSIEANFVIGMDMIKEAFGNFIKKAVKVFDNVKDFIGNILSKVMKSDVMKSIVTTFTKVVEGVKAFFAPISSAFKVLEETASPISKAIEVVKNKIGTIFQFFSDLGTKIGMFGKIFSSVAKIVSKIAFPLTIIMSIWDTVKGAIEGFQKEGIIGAISGAIKGLIGSLITGPIDLLKGIASWVLDMFGFDKASKFLDSFSIDELMKGFVDAIFHPIDTINKMFEGALQFFEKIEIPEIGFTIPIIDKKVSIGPFKPFKKESAAAAPSAAGATAEPAAKVENGAGAKAPAPTTGTLPNAISAEPAANVISTETSTRVTKEDYQTVYQKYIDKGMRPQAAQKLASRDTGMAPGVSPDTLPSATPSAPAPVEANAVYNKSAENATVATENKQSAPVIVNAPTNINNSKSSQNIAMPAPIRNNDSGFGSYIRKSEVFI